MPLFFRSQLAPGLLRRSIGLAAASRQLHISSCRSSPSLQRLSCSYSSSSVTGEQLPGQPPLLRRVAAVIITGVIFVSSGFAIAAAPAMPAVRSLLSPPSNDETLAMFAPGSDEEHEIEDFINRHPLTSELRSRPEFSEARPHLKIPPSFRNHSLTGGTLMGPGKVAVPPVIFVERGGKSLVSITHLGDELCGHPDIIHGGLLATLLDEGLARCCFAALPHNVGMTAKLTVNYRNPTPAGSHVVLRATTTKVEGRKAWVEGRLETLVEKGETPVVLADATALFVSPRQAATMTNIYSAS